MLLSRHLCFLGLKQILQQKALVERTVVITGASGGLGRALAQEAAQRGDVPIGFARDEAGLAVTQCSISTGRFEGEIVDVSEFAKVSDAVSRVIERHGRVDALICNAAVYPRLSLLEQSPDDWMQVLAINVGGVMACIRAVLPSMMAEAKGRIIVVGSFADMSPLPKSSAYSASKGALHSLVKATVAELAGDFPDILVNEWIPGALRTQMGIPEGIDPAEAARWGIDLLNLPPGGPTGRVFERNLLVEPPQSFKRRVLRKLLRR